jgi:hypothetical protein
MGFAAVAAREGDDEDEGLGGVGASEDKASILFALGFFKRWLWFERFGV